MSYTRLKTGKRKTWHIWAFKIELLMEEFGMTGQRMAMVHALPFSWPGIFQWSILLIQKRYCLNAEYFTGTSQGWWSFSIHRDRDLPAIARFGSRSLEGSLAKGKNTPTILDGSVATQHWLVEMKRLISENIFCGTQQLLVSQLMTVLPQRKDVRSNLNIWR